MSIFIQQWQTIFCIASGIYFLGVIFYAIFARGELQDWAAASSTEENMEITRDFEQPSRGQGGGEMTMRKRSWMIGEENT